MNTISFATEGSDWQTPRAGIRQIRCRVAKAKARLHRFNVTARDFQFGDGQWQRGKSSSRGMRWKF